MKQLRKFTALIKLRLQAIRLAYWAKYCTDHRKRLICASFYNLVVISHNRVAPAWWPKMQAIEIEVKS